MRIVIIYHRLGPYHHARLSALSKFCELIVVELSATTKEYSWDKVEGDSSYARHTLFENDSHEINKVIVACKIKDALDEAQPDVVVIPGWGETPALIALMWAQSNGKECLILTESQELDDKRVWWKEWVKKRIIRLSSGVLAGGKRQKNYINKLVGNSENVYTHCNVVDNYHFESGHQAILNKQDEYRRQEQLPIDYFIASSRLIKKKNLFFLLNSYAMYQRMFGPDYWKLVIMGDGPLMNELKVFCKSLSIEKDVHFIGFKQYVELPLFYTLAKVFVHSSTVEQWGLVVNEAMACGLPVLVSRNCGCVEDLIKEGINGFTFDPSDMNELAGLFRQLSTGEIDINRMGEQSLRLIKEYNPSHFARAVEIAARNALLKKRSRKARIIDYFIIQVLIRYS